VRFEFTSSKFCFECVFDRQIVRRGVGRAAAQAVWRLSGRPFSEALRRRSGARRPRNTFSVASFSTLAPPTATYPLLSADQLRAVQHQDGPVLILAGPGTGKTHMIAARVVHLIGQGVPGPNIAVLTFSDRASSHMQSLVDLQVSMGFSDCLIRTFNAFASELLKQFASEIQLSPDFRILSRAEEAVFLMHRLSQLRLEKYVSMDFPNFSPIFLLRCSCTLFARILTRYKPLSGQPTALVRQMLDLFSRLRAAGITAEQYVAWATAQASNTGANSSTPPPDAIPQVDLLAPNLPEGIRDGLVFSFFFHSVLSFCVVT
jgi:hypothetical protein